MPSTHRASPPASSRSPATAWLADWNRQQAELANESAGIVARGFDAMRRIQEQATSDAMQRRTRLAQQLRSGPRSADLFQLAALVRGDAEGATRYWQQMTGAAAEMNSELLACTLHLANTEDVLAATAALFHHSPKT